MTEETLSMLEWIDGEQDCAEGYPPKDNPTDSYLRGYSTRYELEQALAWFTDRSLK